MSGALALEATGARGIARYGLSWPLLVAVGAFMVSLRPALLNDPDSYWHIATARWMFEHLAVPFVDPFSFTMAGKPWIAHEWLAELVLGAAHALGGWAGMAILASASFAVTMAILCRYLLRHLEPIYALFVIILAGAMMMTHLLARPHALVLPLLAWWVVVLMDARECKRAPNGRYALLVVLWANLHGSFPLGVALAAVFAFEAAWEAEPGNRRQVVREWAVFLGFALAATLATPYGVDGILFPLRAQGDNQSADMIVEWMSPSFHDLQPLELAIMAVGGAFLWKGIRVPAVRLLLLLGLLHLALKHARHSDMLGLLAPLVLAGPVGAQWKPGSGAGAATALDYVFSSLIAAARPPAIGIAVAVLALFGWLKCASGVLVPATENTPDRAVQAALAAQPPGKVLNDYNFGGYLIYRGIPTFIDGRGEPYGDRFIVDYDRAINLVKPDSFMELLAQRDIGWTLLRPGTSAIALLDRMPGWRRIYADNTAVVHVRFKRD